MTERMRLEIGPPHSSISEGINTLYRRQQLPPNVYRLLRNIKVAKGALQKSGGRHRIVAGALPAKSAKSGGAGADFVQVAYTDTTKITDYQLGTKFTIFCAYSVNSLATDLYIGSQGTDPTGTPPWSIVHASNGIISARVTDNDGTTLATSTTIAYTKLSTEYQVNVVRSGTSLSIYVNDDAVVTKTGLGATTVMEQSEDDIYFGGYSGAGTGTAITLYESRILRRADTSKDWRMTQYPWTGRFGDPDMVLHLLYEEGSGASLTDYSRIINQTITLEGTWTWLSTTKRQAVAPVTGIHITGSVRGRRWMLADIGKNHYRIALN